MTSDSRRQFGDIDLDFPRLIASPIFFPLLSLDYCSRLSRCSSSYYANLSSELVAAMLSAFTARPIIELRQRDKSKIETILAYGMPLHAHLHLPVY